MAEKFDPKKYMVKMQGNDYLPVAPRITWFRIQHGTDGSIDTELLEVGGLLAVRARIIVSGVVIASGLATVRKFERAGADRSIEKAETAAIGRALACAGYGTMEAGDELDDTDYLAGSPQAKRETDETNGSAVVHFVDVKLNKSQQPYIVAEGGYTAWTREPFRVAGVPCDEWGTPGHYVLDAPVVIQYEVKDGFRKVTAVRLQEGGAK